MSIRARSPTAPLPKRSTCRSRARSRCSALAVRTASALKYDAIIIGAGHNGLVCAFYLARAGMKVLVLERRGIVGGAAVTEEFYPGFRNSVASYSVSLLNPKVIADMALHTHGLRIVGPSIAKFPA